jgi:ketosteroid isomerase-like protein
MPESTPTPIATLLEAANANDTEAFLAMFVDGAVVDNWGTEFAGSEAIRGWSDREFIGKHVNLKIDAIQQQGDLTVVTAQVGGDGFNGPSHFSFLIDGDLVARMTIRA